MNLFIEWITKISFYEFMLLLTSIIGGIVALFQWWKTRQFNRANLIKELLSKIREDNDIVEVLYAIDFCDEWCDNNFFSNRNKQLKFDKTFSLFDYICFLMKKKILSKKEVSFFEYKIIRMANDISFKTYMFNIYHFSKKNNSSFPFEYLIEYLSDNQLLPVYFFNVKSKKYRKYLNF